MVRQPDKERSLEIRPCIGGIQTKYASPIVIPSQSPDALNVSFERRSIKRRAGCVPVNRYLPARNALRNRGRTLVARITGSGSNTDYKVVPGYGFMGHRTWFNDYDDGTNTRLTVSFLTTPEPTGDDPADFLSGTSGNWFNYNENAGATNTYTYRPILSKGPLRATRCSLGERTAFSIFVYNAGAGDVRWGCYVQSNIAAAPILLVSGAGDRTNPKPFHTYRITLSITATGNHPAGSGTARLSVAELKGDGTVVRNTYTTALLGRIPTNRCPIQVFDMPRAQIEAPAANGGLNIAAGYWRTSLRYEGKIQDISYWSVDKTNDGADFSFAESMVPLDLNLTQTGLMGHWAPDTHTYYDRFQASWREDQTTIPESRGLDCPIMLGPNVPVWQRSNGKTGLYFDGRTSYAFMPTSVNAAASPIAVVNALNDYTLVDGLKFHDKIGASIILGIGTANEETATITSVVGDRMVTAGAAVAHVAGDYVGVYGADRNLNYVSSGANVALRRATNSYEAMVLGGPADQSNHTISVTFIPDSFEYRDDDNSGAPGEQLAQTIFRWGGVVDIGISSRGRLFVMPWQATGFTTILFSANTLIPGQRYTVLSSRDTDATANVYINGQNQITTGALTAPAVYLDNAGAAPDPPGLPSFILGTDEEGGVGATTILEDIGATDRELHFVGRIEDVRIGNERLFVSPLTIHHDLTEDELYINTQKLATGLDDSSATGLTARRTFNPSFPLFGYARGITWVHVKFPFFDTGINRVLIINSANDTTYTMFAAPPAPPVGFDDMRDRQLRLSRYLAWWNFQDNTLEAKLESRYRDRRETAPTPSTRQFYQQDLAVPGIGETSFPLTLRSREPDIEILSIQLAAVFTWKDTTPWEIIPKLAMGLVPALPETNPITLISQMKVPRGSFTITAAANTLYWLQPPWKHGDSPYPIENDPDQVSLFASGRMKNHIQIADNSTWDLDANDKTIEFWMKVPELVTRREIALNWNGTTVGSYNWRVTLTDYGALQVDGFCTGTGYWQIGTTTNSLAGDRHSPFTPGRWHHVAITIDVSAIANDRIWIDGVAQPMATPLSTHAANWTGGTGAKWIAGHAIELGSPEISNTLFEEPFLGNLRDFRVSTGLRYTVNFTRPSTPLTADGTTVTLLPLNEGEDLSAGATGSTVARGTIRMEEMLPILDGSLLCNNSSEKFPYSWTQYLDVLYVTNGLGAPLAIRNRPLAGPRPRVPAPDGGAPRPFGFSVARKGVSQPGFDIPRLIGEVPSIAPVVFAEDTPITIAVSFVSEDGIESNPQVYDFTVPKAGGGPPNVGWLRLVLDQIPRSLEPHVTFRRLYTGANEALLVETERRLGDNLSDETELLAVAGTGPIVEANKAAPPPARFITIFSGQSYLLNQPLEAPLELYVSETLNPAVGTTVENFNFPSGIFRLEEGGKGHGTKATFLIEHLGQLFCGKRDSIFSVLPSTLLSNFRLSRVATSKGFAGGHSVMAFDNHLFGSMEKGVHVFDAAGIDYIGEDLEGIWANVDKSETAFLLQHGVYHEPTNQYWLTIRRTGEKFGREIVVFDKVVQDPLTGRHPWTLLSTVRHSYMESVEDEVDDTPLLYLGTPDGQVMQMQVGQIDGSRPVNNPATGTPFTLTGASGVSTTLTAGTIVGATTFTVATTVGVVVGGAARIGIGTANEETLTVLAVLTATQFTTTVGAGFTHANGDAVTLGGSTTSFGSNLVAFDTLGNGLRGLWLIVTHANGVIEEGRIRSNTGSVIVLEDAMAAAAAFGDTFEIGAYWAYWSSAWLPFTSMAQMKITRWLDLDFVPNAGQLTVAAFQGAGTTVINDAFPWGSVTAEASNVIDMLKGYHIQPCHFADERGFYFRHAFSTRGINKPFEVFGFNVAYLEDGLRKGVQG